MKAGAGLFPQITTGRSPLSIASDTAGPPNAEQKDTLAMPSRGERYASPAFHEQTVSEAKDAWRNEGNPN